MQQGAVYTPGRVAWVYFSHKSMIDELSDKPLGWSKATASGRYPHLCDDWVMADQWERDAK